MNETIQPKNFQQKNEADEIFDFVMNVDGCDVLFEITYSCVTNSNTQKLWFEEQRNVEDLRTMNNLFGEIFTNQ